MLTAYYHSLIGCLEIAGTEAGIARIGFVAHEHCVEDRIPDALAVCVQQLDEYFQGTRTTFSVDLAPRGTDFQQRVWRALLTIPYGQTTTYQQMAAALANPHGSQAVGRANGANPIAILIPCHRVIGRKGQLTGYAGGLWRKEWLLRHEGALLV